MSMRKQFTTTMTELEEQDDRVIVLLNDIGVWAFRFLKEKYPDRVHNLGILEQASIGVAAGLSMTGFVPVFHTIAPFIVSRAYEQLKDDFGYQNINGNFVSIGASFDYSGLGTTHYCPEDVGALMQIPNMQILLPGTAREEDLLIKATYQNGKPTYTRLSEFSNGHDYPVQFGKAQVIKTGQKGTVIAVGTMLDKAIEATREHDVTLLYYTTIVPFDKKTLRETSQTKKFLVCEPYYTGALARSVVETFPDESLMMDFVGIPHQVISTYGTVAENERELHMTAKDIQDKLRKMGM